MLHLYLLDAVEVDEQCRERLPVRSCASIFVRTGGTSSGGISSLARRPGSSRAV